MDLNEEVPQSLEALVKPHVDSFDWFVDKGIQVRPPPPATDGSEPPAEPMDGKQTAAEPASTRSAGRVRTRTDAGVVRSGVASTFVVRFAARCHRPPSASAASAHGGERRVDGQERARMTYDWRMRTPYGSRWGWTLRLRLRRGRLGRRGGISMWWTTWSRWRWCRRPPTRMCPSG